MSDKMQGNDVSTGFNDIAKATVEIKSAKLRDAYRGFDESELLYPASRELFRLDCVQGACIARKHGTKDFNLIITVALGHSAAQAREAGQRVIIRELYRPGEK